MTFRALTLAACLGCLSIPAAAQEVTELTCLLEEDLDLLLLLPAEADLSAREIDLIAVPGPMGERPALARFAPLEEDPIDLDYVIAIFALDETSGAALMLAENGDALLRFVDPESGMPTGQPDRLGSCDNAAALFARRG